MATVVNKGMPAFTDKKYNDTNRKISGSPVGTTTPLYKGEIVQDTATGNLYFANDLTNTGWCTVVIGG